MYVLYIIVKYMNLNFYDYEAENMQLVLEAIFVLIFLISEQGKPFKVSQLKIAVYKALNLNTF